MIFPIPLSVIQGKRRRTDPPRDSSHHNPKKVTGYDVMPFTDRIRSRLVRISMTAALALVLLTGCGSRIYLTTGFEEGQLMQINGRYASAAELRVYILDQIKQCQLVMGAEALQGAGDSDMNEDLKTRIRAKSLNQVTRVRTLNLMAIQDNIMLTNAENDLASEAARSYYEGLTLTERDYLDTDLEALIIMFRQYALAVKTCSSIGDAFEDQYNAFLSRVDLNLNADVWNSVEARVVDPAADASNTFRNAYIRTFTKQ